MAADASSELLEERPLRELVSHLAHDSSQLIQQELALAKQEAREKADELTTHVLAAASGVAVLHVGMLALVAALILLLARAVPDWSAALIVGGVFCVAGGVMFARGKRQIETIDLKPTKTIDSVQRDMKAIKEAAE